MNNRKHNETTDNPFHPSLVQEIIQSSLRDCSDVKMNFRISDEALLAAGEVLRLFVQEAWHRANIEAECDHEGTLSDNDEKQELNLSLVGPGTISKIPVRPDHITKIVAELLMDFS